MSVKEAEYITVETQSRQVSNFSIRNRWNGFLVAAGLSILTVACGVKPASQAEATTNLELLDVTGAAAGKVSKKNESYWQKSSGDILRCYHSYPAGSSYMDAPFDCEQFVTPAILPSGSKLEAINKGIGQKNLSFWGTPNGRLIMCEHEESWSTIANATGCAEFQRPPQIDASAKLSSINSGSGQEAQSFWNNLDGSVTACNHEKTNSGFLGFGNKGIGATMSCEKLPTPTEKLPKDSGTFKMVGINSDGSRPMQTFWQSDTGAVAQCFHDKDGGAFSNKRLGRANECQLWTAPKV